MQTGTPVNKRRGDARHALYCDRNSSLALCVARLRSTFWFLHHKKRGTGRRVKSDRGKCNFFVDGPLLLT
jgi:hypothetical protein